MVYTAEYASPLGMITLACDGEAITGLWFNGQKHFGSILPRETLRREHPLFAEARRWLDIYFSGREPGFLPPLRYDSTPFRKLVCAILLTIPYGETMTYGEIAAEAARRQGVKTMSAQAVGGAVGHNEISIIIPCHRVVGTNGSLTGYAGGVETKRFLLQLERSANGGYPCPCCGCRTFPVPAADALAYICPVCMWENDLFIASDDEPSDENHGLTLNQGRENFKMLGVCHSRLAQYARKPLPEEL